MCKKWTKVDSCFSFNKPKLYLLPVLSWLWPIFCADQKSDDVYMGSLRNITANVQKRLKPASFGVWFFVWYPPLWFFNPSLILFCIKVNGHIAMQTLHHVKCAVSIACSSGIVLCDVMCSALKYVVLKCTISITLKVCGVQCSWKTHVIRAGWSKHVVQKNKILRKSFVCLSKKRENKRYQDDWQCSLQCVLPYLQNGWFFVDFRHG